MLTPSLNSRFFVPYTEEIDGDVYVSPRYLAGSTAVGDPALEPLLALGFDLRPGAPATLEGRDVLPAARCRPADPRRTARAPGSDST